MYKAGHVGACSSELHMYVPVTHCSCPVCFRFLPSFRPGTQTQPEQQHLRHPAVHGWSHQAGVRAGTTLILPCTLSLNPTHRHLGLRVRAIVFHPNPLYKVKKAELFVLPLCSLPPLSLRPLTMSPVRRASSAPWTCSTRRLSPALQSPSQSVMLCDQ